MPIRIKFLYILPSLDFSNINNEKIPKKIA